MADANTPTPTLYDRLQSTLHMAVCAPVALPKMLTPMGGGEWDMVAIRRLKLAQAMAANVGAYAIFHDTGDGWVFGWERDGNLGDPTESLEPLLPYDWWPGPYAVTRVELESLGMVEV